MAKLPVPKNPSPYIAGKIVRIHAPELAKAFSHYKGGVAHFLSASSAKVLEAQRIPKPWANVVLYHSPADRAMLSFVHAFGTAAAKSVFRAVAEAAKTHPEWRDFAYYKPSRFKDYLEEYGRVTGSVRQDFYLPDAQNRVRPLSLCPYATDDCRAVCLNTSGRGGWNLTKKEAQRFYMEHTGQQKLPEGLTLADITKYMHIHGVEVGENKKAFYGGEMNTPQAARCKRTHLMWYAWAKQGVIRNFYNDIIYQEALWYQRNSKYPMALRLNGTSDIPVHTLELTNGRNLVQELGKAGIVCYDYTKSYGRMKDWLSAQKKSGDKAAWNFKGRIGKGTRMLPVPGKKSPFPSNYYLCFSYSEWNAKASMNIIRAGGNVVMVMAPSKHMGKIKKSDWKPPTRFSLGALKAGTGKLIVDVVDGDYSDIRFSDPFRAGKGGTGVIAALKPKGEAKGQDFSASDRDHLWKRFIQTVSLVPSKREVIGIPRKNPLEDGAASGVDPQLAAATFDKEGKYYIAPTSVGT